MTLLVLTGKLCLAMDARPGVPRPKGEGIRGAVDERAAWAEERRWAGRERRGEDEEGREDDGEGGGFCRREEAVRARPVNVVE